VGKGVFNGVGVLVGMGVVFGVGVLVGVGVVVWVGAGLERRQPGAGVILSGKSSATVEAAAFGFDAGAEGATGFDPFW